MNIKKASKAMFRSDLDTVAQDWIIETLQKQDELLRRVYEVMSADETGNQQKLHIYKDIEAFTKELDLQTRQRLEDGGQC